MAKSGKSGLVVFAILLAFLLVSIRQVFTWDRESSVQKSVSQDIREHYPIADSIEPESSDPKERDKRQKRSKKYNQKTKGIGPSIVQTAEGYHWPSDFPPIPVSLSDLVIIGTISKATAHLAQDKNSVYSEFTIRVAEVLKSDTPNLLQGNSIITERRGGRVRYPSGQVSWLFLVGQGMPRFSGTYLLFLKRTDEEDQVYAILTGYELRDGRIIPLDYAYGGVGFARYDGSDATVFLNEVRNAIEKCSTSASQD